MDPERWPDEVRVAVDQIGSVMSGVTIRVAQLIAVDTSEHFGWLIATDCPCCHSKGTWQILGAEPKPAPPTSIEPAWYSKLTDLPPGGGTP